MQLSHYARSDLFLSPNIQALEARIAALEKGQKFEATQKAVAAVEADCLKQLREVRAAVAADSGAAASSAAAVAEKEALTRKIAKLEYRVQHLLGSMDMLYEKSKATSN